MSGVQMGALFLRETTGYTRELVLDIRAGMVYPGGEGQRYRRDEKGPF